MEKLTKQQAVEEHRKMWRWIAEETEKQKRIVYKWDYLKFYDEYIDLANECFCCEYTYQHHRAECEKCPIDWDVECEKCPIDWDSECDEYMCQNKTDFEDDNLYTLWNRACGAENWKEAAKLARQIAELPESEEEE